MTEKQIIDKLKNDVACKENIINHLAEYNIKLENQLKRKEQELKKICKAFDIEYAIDEETGNLFGRCNKLYKKEQECEELKEERNEYFELMAIRTEILAKIANKLGMNTGIIENKELFYKIDQLKADNDLFRTCHDNEQEKRRKYEQTLIEIKEYCTDIKKDHYWGMRIIRFTNKILQKIRECEVEND